MLREYTLDVNSNLRENSIVNVMIRIIPLNNNSSASAYVIVKKAGDDDEIYKSPPVDFKYTNSNTQNKFEFMYNTSPSTTRIKYIFQFVITFDNSVESKYTLKFGVDKTSKRQQILIDKLRITPPPPAAAGGKIELRELELITTDGGINLINSTRMLIIDGVSGMENLYQPNHVLTANENINLLFFPTQVSKLSVNIITEMVVELLLEDRLVFASNTGMPQLGHQLLEYNFSQTPFISTDEINQIKYDNDIEFGGMLIATPDKIWYVFTIIGTIVLLNISSAYPNLSALQFLTPIPILLFILLDLGHSNKISFSIPDPSKIDDILAADMKYQLIFVGIIFISIVLIGLVTIGYMRSPA